MKSNLYFGLICLVLFFSFWTKMNAQPSWAWVLKLSATNGIYGHAIAIDPNGSGEIYVAGGFEGITDFDPGPETFTLNSGSPNDVGIFVAKYDGSGNFVWSKALVGVAGSGAGSPYSIAIDPTGSGAIYTTGRFLGTIDFDPGPNTFNLTSVGNNDIFISKLDGEGNLLWAKATGGTADDIAVSLTFDPGENGSVYTTGQFKGTVDFDPGDSTFNLTSASGYFDIFISKLDGEGNFLWAKSFGGTRDDVCRDIAIDTAGIGKLYVTGQFYGTVDFDPGDSTFNLTAVNQENFVSILDASGNFLEAKRLGGVNLSAYDRDGAIVLGPAGSGDVYITNAFEDTVYFDPGDSTFNLTSAGDADIFISKLSNSNQFTWAKSIGGLKQEECIDIAFAPGGTGNVFTLGMFQGTADFDPGVDTVPRTSAGDKDIFISSLDSLGNFHWIKIIKGVGGDYGQSMVTDGEFLYVTGAFFGTSISFDSINFINNNTTGVGADLYIAKLPLYIIDATADLDSKSQKIKIYPNPATNEMTIELAEGEFFNADINLYNVLGEVVYFRPREIIGNSATIDISALSEGIYFVELNINGKRMIEKVVKK